MGCCSGQTVTAGNQKTIETIYVPNTKLLTGQVEYGLTDLSKVAIEYAKTEKIKGARNMAPCSAPGGFCKSMIE
jgi:hypothetical protein